MKYERNREKSKSKGPKKFSKNFFKALTKAKENKQLGGKNRIYNIKSFVHCYKKDNPLDTNIPSFKTVYRYIKKV